MLNNFSSNATFPIIDDYELFDDYDRHYSATTLFHQYALLVIIVVGLLFNILAVLIQIRRRLWRQHVGHVYLSGIFIISIITITALLIPHFIAIYDYSYHIERVSLAACRVWYFLTEDVIFITRWLLVAVLFNVYWRQRIDAQGSCSGCGCRNLVAKCCTLFAVKITILSIIVASLLANLWLAIHPLMIRFDDEERVCYIDYGWYMQKRAIFIAWRCVTQEFPLFLLTPVLWALILCNLRTANRFSFTRLGSDDASDNKYERQFATVSLVITAAVVVLKAPHSLRDLIFEIDFEVTDYRAYIIIWYLVSFLSYLHLAVVPVVCVAMFGSMRQFIRSEILQKCCPRIFSRPDLLPVHGTDDSIPLEESFN